MLSLLDDIPFYLSRRELELYRAADYMDATSMKLTERQRKAKVRSAVQYATARIKRFSASESRFAVY